MKPEAQNKDISVSLVDERRTKVWISHRDGEGGEFDRRKFEQSIGMTVPKIKTKATKRTWKKILKFFIDEF